MRRLSIQGRPVFLAAIALALASLSLLAQRVPDLPASVAIAIRALDGVAVLLVLLEFGIRLRNAPVVRNFLRFFVVSHILMIVLVILFLSVPARAGAYQTVLIIRNLIVIGRIFSRVRNLSLIVTDIVTHPARTVAFSFLLVIVVGTLLLMMPFTTLDGEGLAPVDALFTATSAVCVTGLIVVDTATVYTLWGQLVILLLIQIGGLGIMILSLFAVVLMRQSLSVGNQMLLSYMLSEHRIKELATALKRIIVITFGVEGIGAVLLFFLFAPVADGVGHQVLLATFHAVSAFCNAGFALFTTSLEQFHSHLAINLVIAFLVIVGGLSFAVLTNVTQVIRNAIMFHRRNRNAPRTSLTVNSRAVLSVTGILLLAAWLIFYALEHDGAMANYSLGTQYLGAFFQAVTFRTAGFNTIPMQELATATYLAMIMFMFIGGAAGSTAGGIKVNNVAVIAAFLESSRRNRRQTLLFGHAVTDRQTATAFSVLLFGLLSVMGGTLLLTITEAGDGTARAIDLTPYLFESVSAFATVGLSTGITPNLSVFGRLTVTSLMFIGRVGPLTLLAASGGPRGTTRIEYPTAGIAVG